MFDIKNRILINLYSLSPELQRRAPLRFTHQEFKRGYKAGAAEAAAGEVAGVTYTDKEIVDMLKEFFSDPERTDESLYYSVGALFGQILAP